MPHPVGLVLRHQRRPVAGEAVADRSQLGELASRPQPGVVVLENVGPEDAAGDEGREHGCLDDPPAPEEERTDCERRERHGRRGSRERLPRDPRGTRSVEHQGARDGADDVERHLPHAAKEGPDHGGGGGGERNGDQDVSGCDPARIDAEVAHGPDARDLDWVERLDQVCEWVERDDVGRDEVGCGDDRGQAEHDEGRGKRRGRAKSVPEATVADDHHERECERGGDPHERSEIEDAEEQRGDRSERDHVAKPLRAHRRRDDRGQEGQCPCGAELLDPSPERVAIQKRRLGGDECHQAAQPARADQPVAELVQ